MSLNPPLCHDGYWRHWATTIIPRSLWCTELWILFFLLHSSDTLGLTQRKAKGTGIYKIKSMSYRAMKIRFYFKKAIYWCSDVAIKNTEMDKLVWFAVHLSQQPMPLDGQRKCLEEEGKIRGRNYQGIHSTGKSKTWEMSFLYDYGLAFYLVVLTIFGLVGFFVLGWGFLLSVF